MTLAAAVLLGACVAAEVAALGLAVVVVGRDAWQLSRNPGNKLRKLATNAARSPLARLLAFAVLADVLGAVCSLVADMGPRPRAGWHRVTYHLADALVMAWPLAVCWTARCVFSPVVAKRPVNEGRSVGLDFGPSHRSSPPFRFWPFSWGAVSPNGPIVSSANTLPAVVPASFALGTLALVLVHPVQRVWTQRTLHAHELLCVAVTWWAVWRGRSLPWRVEHRALVVLASFEAVVATVGPFAGDAFQRWPVVGAVLYFAAFSTVAVLLGWELRQRA